VLTTTGLPSRWLRLWLFRVSSSSKNFSASMAVLPQRSNARRRRSSGIVDGRAGPRR
jgi:hypothetical protein